jgi:hypothetical protein
LRQGVKEVIICGPESVCQGGGTVIYSDWVLYQLCA